MSLTKEQQILLKALIREALVKEDDYGDMIGADDYYGYGGYGGGGYGGYGNGSDLYKTFVQPFVDVGKTIAYGIENMSQRAQRIIKTVLYGLPQLIIPFVEFDWEGFRKEEQAKLDEIKKKYEKVLNVNWEAITSNDAFGLAFVLNPTITLGTSLATKLPSMAFNILSTLVGGSEKLTQLAQRSHSSFGLHSPYDPFIYTKRESVLNEKDVQPQVSAKDIKTLLKNPEVVKAIQNNPFVKQAQKEAIDVLVNRVKRFMAAKTFEELKQKAGEGLSSIENQVNAVSTRQRIAPQELAGVKNALLPKLKKEYKDFYIKKLQEMLKQYPPASDVIQQAITTLQALK